MFKKITAITAVLTGLIFGGCTKERPGRAFPEKEFVTIYYCAGFNNLSSDIRKNVEILKAGDLPFEESRHKMLVFSHFSVGNYDYSTLTDSHLVLYTKDFGRIKADTLLTIDKSRYATDPAVMREVLATVRNLYPDAHYGLVVSSHGTGWLPAGKYSSGSVVQMARRRQSASELPAYRYNADPDSPKVKTFGAEVKQENSTNYSVEMTIQSMAKAIPMHLDYLLFDACLMGGIEVAYELKDVADKIAFSPTEVLAQGFDYSNISYLLADEPSIEGFCKLYFDHYNSESGSMRSATISVVRSSGLDALADVCADMFGKYRSSIDTLSLNSGIQRYFRSNYHWFFDMEDILVKAGLTDEDKATLENALDGCISYKAATPQFLGIEIKNYSGLSMYLPSATVDRDGKIDAQLNEFYRTLAWNKATYLVE